MEKGAHSHLQGKGTKETKRKRININMKGFGYVVVVLYFQILFDFRSNYHYARKQVCSLFDFSNTIQY